MSEHPTTDATRAAVKRLLAKRPHAFEDVLEQLFGKMAELEEQLATARAQLACPPPELELKHFSLCRQGKQGICITERSGKVLRMSAKDFDQLLEKLFYGKREG